MSVVEAINLETFEWHMPTKILFGWGERARLAQEAARLGMKKAFVVTDDHIVKDELFKASLSALEQAGPKPTVWDGVRADPTDTMIREATAAYRRAGCDGVIGYGGGSSMDTAKGVAVLTHGKEDCIRPYLPPESKPIAGRVPLIAVTTTSGTGSEVARGAAITDTRTGVVKSGLFSIFINPDVAIVDPELTVSCPPLLTASVGLDAFAHALEGYTSRNSSAITDAVNFYAVELVANHLPNAVYHGHDRTSRIKMAQASLCTGLGFPGRLWYGHDISGALYTLHHTQHGFTIWVVLPALLELNLPALQEKLLNVAPLFGVDPNGGSPREVGLATIREVAEFVKGVGAPTLAELTGCGEEMIDEWVKVTIAKPGRFGAPMQLTEKTARWVFERSLRGY